MKRITRKQINIPQLKKLALAIVMALLAVIIYSQVQPHTQEAKQQRELETKSTQLKTLRHTLIEQETKDQQQDATKQKQIEELNNQLKDVQKQLEAKRASQTAYAAEVSTYTAPVQKPVIAAVNGCGDNTYANYIYMHESGCRTDAINEIGACGIGQALPCGKMGCGLGDYACQNAYFTNYAIQRYGSWASAYNFWVNNHWW
jgi:hypothetical protein